MKYDFVHTHEAQFRVASLCRVLRVSRSGYYAWRDRSPSARARADERLLEEIWRVHHAHYEAYGALKTWRSLNGQGIACGKHRVARIMRRQKIRAIRGYKTPRHIAGRPSILNPNRLNRELTADVPDRAWVTDITYIRT